MSDQNQKPSNAVFRILTFVLLVGILGSCCVLFFVSGFGKPIGMTVRNIIDQAISYTNSPTPGISEIETTLPPPTIDTPTVSSPQWIWNTFGLYEWNVELPHGWTITEINRRPEPTAPGTTGSKLLGHDCADYQLSSPDEMDFINITMPCGFEDGGFSPCGPDAQVIQSVGNGNYLIRFPHPTIVGFVYVISNQGTYEDISGKHTFFSCGGLKPEYLYWRIGHSSFDYLPDEEIDRIMLSMLTNNIRP